MANKALNQVSQVQSTELANVKTFLAVMNSGEIKRGRTTGYRQNLEK